MKRHERELNTMNAIPLLDGSAVLNYLEQLTTSFPNLVSNKMFDSQRRLHRRLPTTIHENLLSENPFRTSNRDVRFTSNTQTVSTTGAAIADYTLPDGFDDGYAANAGGFSLVSYTAVDGQSHIYLLQAPPTLKLDQAQMEQQGNLSTGSNGWAEVQVVAQQPCQIRGQETTLVISEGINHDGNRYRSASAIFAGNDGLALVNISGQQLGSGDGRCLHRIIQLT